MNSHQSLSEQIAGVLSKTVDVVEKNEFLVNTQLEAGISNPADLSDVRTELPLKKSLDRKSDIEETRLR